MSNLELENKFSVEMEKLTTDTPNHADVFNQRYQQCMQNDRYVKNQIEKANKTVYGTLNVGYGNIIDSNKSLTTGHDNKIEKSPTSVTTGEGNTIESESIYSADNAIVGGYYNGIRGTYTTKANAIVGASGGLICAQTDGGISNTVILGGKSNIVSNDCDGGAIIAGFNNQLSPIKPSSDGKINTGSVIIGGKNNMNKANIGSVIILGSENDISNTSRSFVVMAYGANVTGALEDGGIIAGKYPKQPGFGDMIVIGNGHSKTVTSNAARLTTEGYFYYNTGCGAGADYAEFFEWSDGNPNDEDRCGVFVSFDFDCDVDYSTPQELPKIKIAQPGDYILGVISGNPSFVGNADEEWKKRWIYDDFDRPILETIKVPITETQEVETGEYRIDIQYDEEDNEIEVQVPITELREVETGEYRTEIVQKQNENYDESMVYESRFERKEWETTGLLGVLSIKDDGTCQPGKYCKCGENGIATLADKREIDTYLVIRRINENVIKIMFK